MDIAGGTGMRDRVAYRNSMCTGMQVMKMNGVELSEFSFET
jgi:hypothetical protein